MDIVIVGGGLAGLTAAHDLHRAGMAVEVLEARGAVGGRIRTISPEGTAAGAWFDLGATWHWSNQPAVRELAAAVGLEAFPQYRDGVAMVEDPPSRAPRPVSLPPPSPAELRFVGGTQALCQRLADRLPTTSVRLDTEVVAVDGTHGGGVKVSALDPTGDAFDIGADAVIVALPPRLASQDIAFTPALAPELVQIMQATPTWMGTAVKCVAVYDAAFWRTAGRSGLALNLGGPLLEVHDGCTADGSAAALWGFLSADHTVRDIDFDDRIQSVFEHLGRLFGADAADPAQYFERDWSNDPYTNDEVLWLGDPLDYGHPALSQPIFGGRLVWAGTETADVGGGHMEGAVRSGHRAARQVLDTADR
ncbi:MAG TPA: FAD-dependent oxidoreductase [Acidimicrobiales bacterium]|jgi:monoamine oxidase|nr:FAD-dependent oxidoreductase [Acidimicrobiales bacterium]